MPSNAKTKQTWCLVFWVKTKTVGVIPNTYIKGKPKVGSEVEAGWKQEGKTTFHTVRILKISDDRKDLADIDVDTDGNIMSGTQKGFLEPVLAKKREILDQGKSVTKQRKKVESVFQKSILHQESLFSDGSASDSGDESNSEDREDTPPELDSVKLPHGLADSESHDLESKDDTAALIDKAVLPEVSMHDIIFFRSVLRSLEDKYEWQVKQGKTPVNLAQLSRATKSGGKGLVEILPGCKVFLPENIKIAIEIKSGKDWKILIRHALIEFYGDQLHLLSAKGTRSSAAVDADVYNTLLDWGTERSGDNLRLIEKDVVKHINKLCSNRRRTSPNRTAGKGDANKGGTTENISKKKKNEAQEDSTSKKKKKKEARGDGTSISHGQSPGEEVQDTGTARAGLTPSIKNRLAKSTPRKSPRLAEKQKASPTVHLDATPRKSPRRASKALNFEQSPSVKSGPTAPDSEQFYPMPPGPWDPHAVKQLPNYYHSNPSYPSGSFFPPDYNYYHGYYPSCPDYYSLGHPTPTPVGPEIQSNNQRI